MNSAISPKRKSALKKTFPYLMIFVLGILAYYFFFANTPLNLSGLFQSKIAQKSAPLTVKDTRLMELQKNTEFMSRFSAWIKQFYFEVSDKSILDPNSDNSGNGLTNLHKYLLGLNPKNFDTLGLGMPDSLTVLNGIDPNTGVKLTEKQQQAVDNYFDLEIINNRLAVESLKRSQNVAGERLFGDNGFSDSETPRSGSLGISGAQTRGFENPALTNSVSENLNLDIPGRLEIPSLKINVPLIFTKEPKNFEKDLQLGVVHYPGTAVPGQVGTSYISGHSSNFAWAKGVYNQVFAKLGDLPDNSSFVITVAQNDGKDIRFHYVVTGRKEYSPTDQEQFRNSGESVVALSTCWPIGSTKSRLVVFGKLTQVEK